MQHSLGLVDENSRRGEEMCGGNPPQQTPIPTVWGKPNGTVEHEALNGLFNGTGRSVKWGESKISRTT